MRVPTRYNAVSVLVGGGISGRSDGSEIDYHGKTPPTESAITAKLAELLAAEPIRFLREQRDVLLVETDWTGLTDLAITNEKSAEWKLYRQKLRDLPATANPTLDENENLTNVTWPTKPE
jgi:hypothetical protein